MPLVQPAGDHAGRRFRFRDQRGGAIRIDGDVDGLLAGAQRVAGRRSRLRKRDLDVLALQALQEVERRIELDPTPTDSGETSVKSFGAAVMPSSIGLAVQKFLFADVGIVRSSATSVTVWPTLIWPRKSKVSPVGLRVSLTVTGGFSPMLCGGAASGSGR